MLFAISMPFQGYIDLFCASKQSRDVRENRNWFECTVFQVFVFSQERFGVQRGSIFSWKGFETAGDIG